MSFKIDQQTKKDLELFEENNGGNSIFSFFNKTRTIGGRSRLMEIMKAPSNNKRDLIARIESLRFFQTHDLNLEFSTNQLDFIEYYLNLNTPILKKNIIDVYFQRISYWLQPNNNFYIIQTGINKISLLLRDLLEGLKEIDNEKAPLKLKDDLKLLNLILNNKAVCKIYKSKRPSFQDYLNADVLFRKQMKEQFALLKNIVYEFDVLQSLVKVAKSKNLVLPTYTDHHLQHLKIESLFHPFVENPIANDVFIDENQNLLFLSGANMAGKSTFLKSVGLSIYLAHLGFPVPAKSMQTSIYNGLITTINLSDSIDKGYSHFYSEVIRVKETALMIKERRKVFVIFDELFRGTNVKDAYDASLEIISAFSTIKESSFFISTHITEVAKHLTGKDIQFRCFNSQLINQIPTYTYKLNHGVSNERMGMSILKNEKISEILASINHINN